MTTRFFDNSSNNLDNWQIAAQDQPPLTVSDERLEDIQVTLDISCGDVTLTALDLIELTHGSRIDISMREDALVKLKLNNDCVAEGQIVFDGKGPHFIVTRIPGVFEPGAETNDAYERHSE